MTTSVVIPAYNAAGFLGQAIDSVLAQSQSAHEIIVVNDGSTDDTHSICLSYGNRICYIQQENSGPSAARNAGVLAATGDWIAFLDSDDIMMPDRLAIQSAAVESNPSLVLSYSAFTFLYGNGTTKFSPAFPAKELWPALRYRSPILPSTMMVRKDAFVGAGGFKIGMHYAEDWELYFRMILSHSAKAFCEISQSLVLYREVPSGLSKNYIKVTQARFDMLDVHLLHGTSGMEKIVLRRQIEAKFFHELSVAMRENNDPHHWEFALKSLLKWPLFGKVVTFGRYKIFANMAYKRLAGGLRFRWPARDTSDY